MSFRVEVTPPAKRDAILDWLLSQYAGETRLRWSRGMDEAIQSLAHLPERCKLAPENCSVPFKMWQLLYGHRPHVYRILFTIDFSPNTPLKSLGQASSRAATAKER